MSRPLNPNVTKVYRLKLTTTTVYMDGSDTHVYIEYIGPYSNESTIKAQITRAKRSRSRFAGRYSDVTVETLVEVADVNWREL